MIDLEAIDAREKATTKGPWYQNGDYVQTDTARREDMSLDQMLCDKHVVAVMRFGHFGDACFVARARDDVPAMSAEIKLLRCQLAAANEAKETAEREYASILEWAFMTSTDSKVHCMDDGLTWEAMTVDGDFVSGDSYEAAIRKAAGLEQIQ